MPSRQKFVATKVVDQARIFYFNPKNSIVFRKRYFIELSQRNVFFLHHLLLSRCEELSPSYSTSTTFLLIANHMTAVLLTTRSQPRRSKAYARVQCTHTRGLCTDTFPAMSFPRLEFSHLRIMRIYEVYIEKLIQNFATVPGVLKVPRNRIKIGSLKILWN